MALFKLICSLMIIFVQARTIPIIQPRSTSELPQNTFYSAINNSCINASELMTQENEVFKNCINATEILNTTKLTSNNTQTVKCLLYYNRIVSYCKSNPSEVHYPTLKEIGKTYNSLKICEGISNYSKGLFKPDGISSIHCILLCVNFDEQLAPECLFAHYYHTHLNATIHFDKPSAQQPIVPKPIDPKLIDPKLIDPKLIDPKLIDPKPIDTKPIGPQPNVPKPNNQQQIIDASEDTKGTPTLNVDDLPKKGEIKDRQQVNEEINDAGENDKGTPTLNEKDLSKKEESKKKPEVSATVSQNTQQAETDNKAKESNVEEPNNNDEPPIKLSQPIKTTKVPVNPKEPDTSVDKQNAIHFEPSEDEMEDQVNQNYNNANDETLQLDNQQQQSPAEEEKEKAVDRKPDTLQENPINVENVDEIDGESYFMSYFMVVCVLVVLSYVGYHNRVKVMALVLEGKRNRRQHRGRRPNSANYHKLDSNLEEAISSNVTKNSTNVIY